MALTFPAVHDKFAANGHADATKGSDHSMQLSRLASVHNKMPWVSFY
jgi:hypothetical protein